MSKVNDKKRPSDKHDLLASEDVNRWYENLSRGSTGTAEEYLRWLNDYCRTRSVTPEDLITEFKDDKKKAQDRLEDYIRSLEKRKSPIDGKPLRPKTLNAGLSALRSWFKHFELEITRSINLGNVKSTPTIAGEFPPSAEELRKILDHGNPRTRAAIALIAFAGIRPGAVSQLKLSDLPELAVAPEVKALKEPMIIRVREEISKNKRSYLTFLIEEGISYLTAYLHERIANGDTISPESPVIGISTSTMSKGILRVKGDAMGRKGITALIRRAMRASGTSVAKFRPYVLRSYFDWGLQSAKLPHVWEAYVMGHVGPIEADYSVRKNLRDEQIEELRTAFKQQVESVLTTRSKASGVTITALELKLEETKWKSMLDYAAMQGDVPWDSDSVVSVINENGRFGEELFQEDWIEIFKVLVTGLSSEYKTGNPKVRKVLKKAISILGHEQGADDDDINTIIYQLDQSDSQTTPSGSNKSRSLGRGANGKNSSQKVVDEGQLQNHLSEGWRVVTALPSGSVVIRPP